MKRKSHTPLKRARISSNVLLKNFAACFIAGAGPVKGVSLKTLKEVSVTAQVASILQNFTFQWQIECSAICRDQNNQEYIVSETVVCKSFYRHSDKRLSEFLNGHHKKLLSSCNQLHLITAAWVAIPTVKGEMNISIESYEQLYRNLGAFNFASKHEASKIASC